MYFMDFYKMNCEYCGRFFTIRESVLVILPSFTNFNTFFNKISSDDTTIVFISFDISASFLS